MKFQTLSIFLLIVFISCNPKNSDKNNSNNIEQSNKTITLGIQGMTDKTACPQMIEKTLMLQKGINYISINYEAKIMQVIFDSTLIQKEMILESINSLPLKKYKLYFLRETNFDPKDNKDSADIIITTPKTEEELHEVKDKVAV